MSICRRAMTPTNTGDDKMFTVKVKNLNDAVAIAAAKNKNGGAFYAVPGGFVVTWSAK